MDAMSDICNPENYMIYEFPPPEMREGCESFIMDWEEKVEKALINRIDNEGIEDIIC